MTYSSIRSRLLVAFGAAVAAFALLAPSASALTEPKAGYGQFAGCPDAVEAPLITTCFRADITGGHFQMGSKDVPITKTITLTGGYNTKGTEFKASPKGGLIGEPQKIPGGVIGLTGLEWLENLLSLEALELYAATELAGTPGVPLAAKFKLPIKVHLINPVLGKNCYVGSEAEPINLNVTTGTTAPKPPNTPISGTKPTLGPGGSPGITKATGAVYVDNEFGAPAAKGCKLTLLGFIPISLDPVVNLQAGLPSPEGTNETTQDTEAELVSRKFVY